MYCCETMERNFKVTFVLVVLTCFSVSASWYQLFITFLWYEETIVWNMHVVGIFLCHSYFVNSNEILSEPNCSWHQPVIFKCTVMYFIHVATFFWIILCAKWINSTGILTLVWTSPPCCKNVTALFYISPLRSVWQIWVIVCWPAFLCKSC